MHCALLGSWLKESLCLLAGSVPLPLPSVIGESMDHHPNTDFASVPGVLDGWLGPVFQESAHNSTSSPLSNLMF